MSLYSQDSILKLKKIFIVNFRGLFVFFREICSNPTRMGAALPSSNRLAKTMAKQVPLGSIGTIVELGPGTGVVTQALLDHGIEPEKLVLIEKSEPLTKHLKRRFSKLKIIAGDAQDLDHLLEAYHDVTIIVSSLPLRSLPEKIVKKALHAIEKKLAHGGLYIQFSYYQGATTPHFPKTFQRIYSERVFLNFPPARIDVFYHNSKT